jgi:hypothetical protein
MTPRPRSATLRCAMGKIKFELADGPRISKLTAYPTDDDGAGGRLRSPAPPGVTSSCSSASGTARCRQPSSTSRTCDRRATPTRPPWRPSGWSGSSQPRDSPPSLSSGAESSERASCGCHPVLPVLSDGFTRRRPSLMRGALLFHPVTDLQRCDHRARRGHETR